jgi:hypothetical protein
VVAETPARAATSLRVGLLDLATCQPPCHEIRGFEINTWIEPIRADE